MKTQGRKEVSEAVLVATLCAVATGLIGIGIEVLKHKIFHKPEPKKDDPSQK